MKKGAILFFLLYLVVGLYFINFPINYLEIPDYITEFNNWIIFIGGVLIILGGINFLRISSSKKR